MLLKWLRAHGGPASSFARSVIEFESRLFSLVQFASSKACVWSSVHLPDNWYWTCSFLPGAKWQVCALLHAWIPKRYHLACHGQVSRFHWKVMPAALCMCLWVVTLLCAYAKSDRKWGSLVSLKAESIKLTKFSRISVCDTRGPY